MAMMTDSEKREAIARQRREAQATKQATRDQVAARTAEEIAGASDTQAVARNEGEKTQ
jgi:hypothetical protein